MSIGIETKIKEAKWENLIRFADWYGIKYDKNCMCFFCKGQLTRKIVKAIVKKSGP